MKKLAASALAYLAPFAVFAGQGDVTTVDTSGIQSLLNSINDIINLIVPFLIGLAVLFVIIGIFRMVMNAGDEEARDKGKQWVIWGVIGIVLMLAVWGLVALLANVFGGLTDAGRGDVIPNYDRF